MVFLKNFLQDERIGIILPAGYRLSDKQSSRAIEWLVMMELELGIEIEHAARARERRVLKRQVDGYYEDQDLNRNVLEFHGCYWHGCPRCFRVNRDKKPSTGECMDRRYEETVAKTRRMREANYIVTEMWECDFNRLLAQNPGLSELIASSELISTSANIKLEPRDAFYGGRTGNTSRFHEVDVESGEEIRYVDVCSLYPYVCKVGKYPIGHPRLYVGEQCTTLVGTGVLNLNPVEGLVKCVILPPRNLYHPVLPLRMHGKLMFPLCYSCCRDLVQSDCTHNQESDRCLSGTWVSDELKKAVAMGYKVISVSEIWQYQITAFDPQTREGGHFAQYIDAFLKIKQQASGWPEHCTDATSRAEYIQRYKQVEGIELEEEKIAKNPGLRSVSKLCLNSFWGKFGQRDNMSKTTVINRREQLLDLVTNPAITLEDLLPVNDLVMYVRWSFKDECTDASPLANVVIAAYTTAQARLKLYSYLEKLGRRVLYYDTDSVIYTRTNDTMEYEPPVGNFLGDLTDELEQYGRGSFIKAFVSGGAKFYAFIVKCPNGEELEICKVKGIRLDYTTRLKINFKSICEMVTENADPINLKFRAIRRTALHDVVTKDQTKTCRPVFVKRRCVRDSYDTLPYGFINV